MILIFVLPEFHIFNFFTATRKSDNDARRASGAMFLPINRVVQRQQSSGYSEVSVMFVCKYVLELSSFFRLLTLWFDYGHLPEVYEALVEGIKTVRIETWLQVIPQLIARIDTSRHLVGRLIMQLLMDIGREHPQVNVRESLFVAHRFLESMSLL